MIEIKNYIKNLEEIKKIDEAIIDTLNDILMNETILLNNEKIDCGYFHSDELYGLLGRNYLGGKIGYPTIHGREPLGDISDDSKYLILRTNSYKKLFETEYHDYEPFVILSTIKLPIELIEIELNDFNLDDSINSMNICKKIARENFEKVKYLLKR